MLNCAKILARCFYWDRCIFKILKCNFPTIFSDNVSLMEANSVRLLIKMVSSTHKPTKRKNALAHWTYILMSTWFLMNGLFLIGKHPFIHIRYLRGLL